LSDKIDFSKLDPETQEFLRAYLAQEGASEAGEVTPTEFQAMMGQIYYFLKDELVQREFQIDDRLKPLLIGISHLIRTSRLDNPTKIEEMKLRWKRAVRLNLMVLNTTRKMSDMALFDVLVNFGYSVIEDQRQGWRGKLAAERVKTYKIEGGTPKKRGILGWLGLR